MKQLNIKLDDAEFQALEDLRVKLGFKTYKYTVQYAILTVSAMKDEVARV